MLLTVLGQSDPSEVVKLTRHACQNLSISLAVINKWGTTNFTDPLQIAVPGGTHGCDTCSVHTRVYKMQECPFSSFIPLDNRRIPNPPRGLSTAITEDTRVGFFAHFILDMTWLTPEGELFIEWDRTIHAVA